MLVSARWLSLSGPGGLSSSATWLRLSEPPVAGTWRSLRDMFHAFPFFSKSPGGEMARVWITLSREMGPQLAFNQCSDTDV